jgi:TRAP transporter TAXI family solute receptor
MHSCQPMDESTLKKLRFVPVAIALLVAIGVWWNLRASDRTVLVFATGSQDGFYHRLAKQMKTVIEANHPDLRIDLKSSAGSNENIEWLDGGKVHLALVQNDTLGGQSVRSLAGLYPEILHLICRTNASIQTLRDLSGHRVGIGAAGSGTEQITTNLLSFAGVSLEKNQTIRASFGAALEKLRDGQLDAAFFLTGLGSPAISDALSNEQLALVPIQAQPHDADPKEIALRFTDGFRVNYPHISPRIIPQLTYQGRPAQPLPSLSVQAVLVCQKKVNADAIGRITRTLFEQRAVLSQKEPAFTHLDEQTARAALQFPLHEGAENFYRRREPGFVAENAEIMGLLITVLLLLWSILVWARRWFSQSQKNRIDTYYEAVEDVIRRLHDGADLQEIDELETDLLKIRQRASAELVKEQLAADESYIIYQNMLNGCQSMLVRMREKIQASPEKDA